MISSRSTFRSQRKNLPLGMRATDASFGRLPQARPRTRARMW